MAPHSKYRTKICRSFVAGQCAYGDKCTFIHPPPAPFPPSNVLSPFARQLALNWSTLLPNFNKVYCLPPQHSVAGAFAYQAPSPLPSLPGPSAIEHTAIRPENWRTKPCKHFGRTQGWCPVGDACNFIHDPRLLSKDSDVIRCERDWFPRPDDYAKEPRGTNNTAMGATQIHCWAYIHGMCVNPACQLLHPKDATSYIAYTPCFRWPNCPDGVYCAFRHQVPIPVPLTVPAPFALPPIDVTTPEMVPTIPNPLQPVPGQGHLPYNSYEINGTTYFTPQVPAAPIPPNPMFYDHATIAYNGCDSAMYQLGPSFEASNYVYDSNQAMHPAVDWQTHHLSEPQVLESHMPEEQWSGPVDDSDQPATPDLEDSVSRLASTREGEFPYRPPKNQRVGHARRISIQMKKVDT